jgi:excisionase family DNA binding protein
VNPERSQLGHVTAEWLDLKELQKYACVSERTLRDWVHRSINPLPAVRVGSKILVRRSAFDGWLESHRIKPVDVSCIVDALVAGVTTG